MKIQKIFLLAGSFFLIGCTGTSTAVSNTDFESVEQLEETVNEADAFDIKLEQLEGTVGVNDGTSSIESFAGMNLYSGYSLETEEDSYSWINMDTTKLLKMDENSLTNILQKDRHLRITLEEGNLFFCVTEPLDDDETLEFQTSNMSLSIRGTSGIIRHEGDITTIIMLEGEAMVTYGHYPEEYEDRRYWDTLEAGKAYEIFSDNIDSQTINFDSSMSSRGDDYYLVERDIYYGGDVTDFVLEELLNNDLVKTKTEGISTDYMSDEEILEKIQYFIGRYQFKGIDGTGKSGDDSIDINLTDPYLLNIDWSEDGYLLLELSETEDAYNQIEAFNERMIASGNEDRLYEHTYSTYRSNYIRFEDENTLRFPTFHHKKLILQEDGNLGYGVSYFYYLRLE